MFNKLKQFFNKASKDSKHPIDFAEIKHNLENTLARNEANSKAAQIEYERLETIERFEVGKIRTGSVTGRQKRYILQTIRRIRSQLDNLEQRMAIYNKAECMQLSIAHQIQLAETMAQTGIDKDKIEEVMLEYNEQLSKFTDSAETTEDTLEFSSLHKEEDIELEKLEAEILNDFGKTNTKCKDKNKEETQKEAKLKNLDTRILEKEAR